MGTLLKGTISMEAFALLREELKHERAIKAELLEALKRATDNLERAKVPVANAAIAQARAAIAKARNE